MKRRLTSRVGVIFILLLATVGLSAAVIKTADYSYGPLDREFYLTDEQVAFVRPGLNISVQDITIADDGTVTVAFTIADDAGMPLDINGVMTPGRVRVSFLMGYIPQGGGQYVSYTTRTATSSITGESAVQPTSDSGGTLTELAVGSYTYEFGTKLPAGYDRDATHALGFYSDRNLSEFGMPTQRADGVEQLVPSGGEVVDIREIVTDEACAQCHDNLQLHGRRHSVGLCIMCHVEGVLDPDTGNTVDMREMIHKIHSAADYTIIGYRQSVHDYSHVEYPQDTRYCDTCHVEEAAQGAAYMLNPTRAACGSCHEEVNFATGEGHAGGPVISDNFCANCHFPEGELEFDASIVGAHTVPSESSQLAGVNINILDVTHGGVGTSPTILFTVTTDAGETIAPTDMNRLRFLLGGPGFVVSETVGDAAVPVATDVTPAGVQQVQYAYTMEAVIPEGFDTLKIGVEGRVDAVLNPGTTTEMSIRDQADNPVVFFSVTGGEPVPRREIVSDEKCEECHRNLELHGGNRHNASNYCQMCHHELADDSPFRDPADLPARTIDFKMLIHRIHMGEELARDYTVIGYRGTPHNYNGVHYPSNQMNCEKCHVGESYTEARGELSTVTAREFFSPMPPNTTACLGCHDTEDAAAHAFVNIAPFGEACMACHGEGRLVSVGLAHAH
jgi:OmcA/MtrC family decaheme c-type cytochrome